MQIDKIEKIDNRTVKVTIINGCWFSATKIAETYFFHKNSWYKSSTKTLADVWIDLAIKKHMM